MVQKATNVLQVFGQKANNLKPKLKNSFSSAKSSVNYSRMPKSGQVDELAKNMQNTRQSEPIEKGAKPKLSWSQRLDYHFNYPSKQASSPRHWATGDDAHAEQIMQGYGF
jgi:hypothetical protein